MSELGAYRLGLAGDERGTAFVELLAIFVPLWTFALCVVQVALIAQADLIVRHAADSAARSAVVVLPDDPAEYGGEPQMSTGAERLRTIRRAASVPLMPLSPAGMRPGADPTVRGSLASPRAIAGADAYLSWGLDVTLPSVEHDTVVNPEVTVRVAYLYTCGVPLARRIVCDSVGAEGVKSRGLASRWSRDRHRRIVHEATLMVHRAPYTYRGRGAS